MLFPNDHTRHGLKDSNPHLDRVGAGVPNHWVARKGEIGVGAYVLSSIRWLGYTVSRATMRRLLRPAGSSRRAQSLLLTLDPFTTTARIFQRVFVDGS